MYKGRQQPGLFSGLFTAVGAHQFDPARSEARKGEAALAHADACERIAERRSADSCGVELAPCFGSGNHAAPMLDRFVRDRPDLANAIAAATRTLDLSSRIHPAGYAAEVAWLRATHGFGVTRA